MDARELRIGNWVNVPHGNVQIKYFIKEGAHFTDGCGGNFVSLCPIPLTPEILKAAGLLEYDCKNPVVEWHGEISVIEKQADGKILTYYIKRPQIHAEVKVKYLHQLQNLYFSLTGEELNVTL